MDDCSFEGNADLYGLGIRLGFYLQWLTTVLANFVLAKEEIIANGFAFAVYISAVFLNLVVQTTRLTIDPLDVYVTNLLAFGSQFILIPLSLWRMVTCADPFLDPTRWTVITPGLFLRILSVILWVTSSTFQLWYWIHYLPLSNKRECDSYGFLFVKVPLNKPMLRNINITLLSLHELFLLLGLIDYLAKKRREPYLANRLVRTTERRWRILQFIRTAIALVEAVTIFVATELSIKWNNISGVNSLEPSGQLIPLFISSGIFLRVVWVCISRFRTGEAGSGGPLVSKYAPDYQSQASRPEATVKTPSKPPSPRDHYAQTSQPQATVEPPSRPARAPDPRVQTSRLKAREQTPIKPVNLKRTRRSTDTIQSSARTLHQILETPPTERRSCMRLHWPEFEILGMIVSWFPEIVTVEHES